MSGIRGRNRWIVVGSCSSPGTNPVIEASELRGEVGFLVTRKADEEFFLALFGLAPANTSI